MVLKKVEKTYLSFKKRLGTFHASLGDVNLHNTVEELLQARVLLQLAVLCLSEDHQKLKINKNFFSLKIK